MFSTGVQSGPQARAGPDLVEIQSEQVGFQAIGGEAKLRFLPEPWPESSLPRPTSSLLSIASKQGLVAAAGPQNLVIATTQAIRETFQKPDSDFDKPEHKKLRPFIPQLTLDTPRLSHVAFSSDETSLSICAEQGGGIAVYDVQALKQGNKEPSFQISTNGTAIRQIAPNPDPANSHILAVVLENGQLVIASLKDRNIVQGRSGAVLKEGVSCVSWSARGKQLVAGLGNGTASQLTPDGDTKAQIPRPPQLDGDQHSELASWGSKSLKWPMTDCLVSCIYWLSNDQFIITYTPSTQTTDGPPDSYFALVTREPKTANFQFQKMEDPCFPIGMNRFPPHQFMLRLREFPPNLADTVIVSSVASGDIGLFTNSKTPLSQQPHATATANTYTTTTAANDSRRAQLPVKEDMGGDTSAIGIALDLSSTEPVKKPIPGDELEASSTPLPALFVLNNDGLLSGWWFVYNESVRAGSAYPGLIAAGAGQASSTVAQQPPAQQQQTTQQQPSGFAAFGQTSALKPSQSSPFGALPSSQPAFGASTFGQPSQPSTSSAFGSGSTFGTAGGMGGGSAFGSSTLPGSKQSPWGAQVSASPSTAQPAASAFGQSSFGSAASMTGAASGFGVGSGLGKNQSPWAGAGGNQQAQASTANKPANAFSSGSGAAASPFASVGTGNQPQNTAAFASSSFGKNTETASPFGGLGANKPSVFGTSSATATPDLNKQTSFGSAFTIPSTVSGSFGSSATFDTKSPFGTPALSTKTSDQHASGDSAAGDADMSIDGEDRAAQAENKDDEATPKQPLLSNFNLQSSFKGDGTAKDDLKTPQGPSLFGSSFGEALEESSSKPSGTVVKREPKDESRPSLFPPTTSEPPVVDDAPLPPDPTTLPKSKIEEPPLPPEPSTTPKLPPEDAPLPPDPTSTKPEALPVLPALPSKAEEKPSESVPVPLPQSPGAASQSQAGEDKEHSIAGSSPVDLGASASSEEKLSKDRTDAAVTPAKPLFGQAPTPQSTSVFGGTPSWKFGSPDSKEQNNQSPSAPTPSFTPQSEITKPPIYFPKPQPTPQSPRSPSPIRAQRRVRSEESPSRAGAFSQPTTPASNTGFRRPQEHGSKVPFATSRLSTVDEVRPSPPVASKKPEPSEPEIEDDFEDIRQELAAAIVPTKHLDPFIAHQDYVGQPDDRGSVPTQIERIFRDVSSMVDTLGLNSRSLRSFIAGHQQFSNGGRDRTHLEKEDDWCLVEIEELAVIEKELGDRLDFERPDNVEETLSELRNDLKDLEKALAQRSDTNKIVASYTDGEPEADVHRSKQLSAEQSERISDLRVKLANVQSSIAKVEDGVSVLQAKLTTARAVKDGAAKVPTVEAIVNTINKMTRLAEEKRGDVDVLEAQMRRLRFRSTSADGLDESMGALALRRPSSRDSEVYSTPKRREGSYSLDYSPDRSPDKMDAEFRGSRGNMRSSFRNSQGVRQRPKLSQAEIEAYKTKLQRRKKVMGLFSEGILAKGVRETAGNAA